MPIDLAQPRVLAFEVGKRKFSLTVKPITKAMWLKYFSGIVNTQETVKGETSSTYDSTGARLELLESALVDATGYTPEGTPISSVPNWQSALPMSHRRAAADLLVAVSPVEAALGDDYFPMLGTEEVTLKATWAANDKGVMQEITGLVHRFSSPTADHQKRYSRAMSRSIVVGGSRTGMTRWLGAQDVLIDIYDELIQSVDGYELGGRRPAEAMDGYHKVAATQALFEPAQVAEA